MARQEASITKDELDKLVACDSVIKIKEFSHFLKLEGKITLDGEQIKLEGMNGHQGWFFDSLADFLELFVESEDGRDLQFSPENQKILKEALRFAHSQLSDDEVAQRVSNRQLTFIEASWTDHAICLGFFGNYLAICNGTGPAAIKMYQINPKLLTAEIVEQINKNRCTKLGFEFFYRTLPSILTDTKTIERDLLCRSFEYSGPFQEGPNCTLHSKILGVYFAWDILLLIQKNQLKTHNRLNDLSANYKILEKINSEPKRFINWCQGQVFERTFNWLGAEKFKESGLARICLS